jgi:hypothetical protein
MDAREEAEVRITGPTTHPGYPGRAVTLAVTRGLPGCGKTTAALEWLAADQQHRARVNRDDLRGMVGCGPIGTPEQEAAITAMQTASVEALLHHGWDVVVDDTCLHAATLRQWEDLAGQLSARLEVGAAGGDPGDGTAAPCLNEAPRPVVVGALS